MSKLFWAILGATVAALIGVFLIFNHKPATQDQPLSDPNQITAADHVRDNRQAKVTLIEYGDLQCPACKAAFPLIEQLNKDYKTKIRFVFRHFPLTSIHPNAMAAARAAEAAGAQGKFFEMHDLLYQKQDEWSKSTNVLGQLRSYAQGLGLDVDKFNQDYDSAVISDRIKRDMKIGEQLNISGTPTFYLDGQVLDPGPRSYQELKQKVDAELAKKS